MTFARPSSTIFAALACTLSLAGPAAAHHRQTPPIVQLTFSGDNTLPRLATVNERIVVALQTPAGRQIFQRQADRRSFRQLTNQGDNANPSQSANGKVVAWDSDAPLAGGPPFTGRQVFLLRRGVVTQITDDPTGTSMNPSVNGPGSLVAYESQGRIFAYAVKTDAVEELSTGDGSAHNPSYGRSGGRVTFDSTSDPIDGHDTGIAQVWVLVDPYPPTPITHGAAPSMAPVMSPKGRLVAFESRAALADDGHDTGTTQIFAYDLAAGVFMQVTNDPAGCSGPSIDDAIRDWRVTYVCGGRGYYTHLKSQRTFALPIPDGDTVDAVNEGGNFFIQVATTANLLGSGVNPGHFLYQLNIFKLPGTQKPTPPIRTWR